jgi:sugar phosphate isomerase/epimerase
VGSGNLTALLDTWHFARSGGTLTQLGAVPKGLIGGLQISDRREPPPGTAYTPMGGRLLPGEGEIPLVSLLRGLLAREPGLTVAVEVFSDELRALPAHEIAARVASSTRAVLAAARAAPAGPASP